MNDELKNEIRRILEHWETNDGTCGYCMVDLLQQGAEHHELCFMPVLMDIWDYVAQLEAEIERLRDLLGECRKAITSVEDQSVFGIGGEGMTHWYLAHELVANIDALLKEGE